jgi:Periplasmic binding protein
MIKIGAVMTTSGPAALLGSSFLKAIQLAKEDLTNTTHHYDLLIEEIPSPDKAERAIQNLIKIAKVDALVVGLSISGQIVKPYVTAAKIPLFCVCSVSGVGEEPNTFTIMPLAEDEATRWAAEAQRRGIKRVALLTQVYPSIDGHVRALKVEAGNAAGGIQGATPPKEQVAERFAEGPIWVAELEGAIVGTVAAVPRSTELYIRSMAVSRVPKAEASARASWMPSRSLPPRAGIAG